MVTTKTRSEMPYSESCGSQILLVNSVKDAGSKPAPWDSVLYLEFYILRNIFQFLEPRAIFGT